MVFDYEKFEKWEAEAQIPTGVQKIVKAVCCELGISDPCYKTIDIYNRGGHVIGYAKGFTLSHCTFSYETGPSEDYSRELIKFLRGVDFKIENSYGDNGLDSSSNWNDSYWNYDFIYIPTMVWDEEFIVWEEHDYED